MVPIVYSRGYDITAFGLERLHPFDSRKYRRIRDWLVRQGLRTRRDFIAPRPCSGADLLRAHTPEYLRSLRDRRVLARILELPVVCRVPAFLTDWRVLRPMRRAAGGTVLACRLALEKGLAINLGGGYHHAGPGRGGGFCAYADVPLALLTLHEEGRLRSALIVDTDAHQGDGTADAVRPWPWAHMLDFFEQDIFLATDPLSCLCLTPGEMAERDLYVVTEARERGIPVAMVLSGGYGPASWEAHARSIEGLLARFDRPG